MNNDIRGLFSKFLILLSFIMGLSGIYYFTFVLPDDDRLVNNYTAMQQIIITGITISCISFLNGFLIYKRILGNAIGFLAFVACAASIFFTLVAISFASPWKLGW